MHDIQEIVGLCSIEVQVCAELWVDIYMDARELHHKLRSRKRISHDVNPDDFRIQKYGMWFRATQKNGHIIERLNDNGEMIWKIKIVKVDMFKSGDIERCDKDLVILKFFLT